MNIIKEFKGDYRWLSNFAQSPIIYEGQAYPTVEHAYQASKTVIDSEKTDIIEVILPANARHLGQLVTCRPDWEIIKCKIMYDLLELKFAIPYFAQMLKGTNDAKLIEGNHWHDNYFGICYCDKCKGLLGSNMLGSLLMLKRSKL